MFTVSNRDIFQTLFDYGTGVFLQVSEISKGPGTRIHFFGNILSMLHEE